MNYENLKALVNAKVYENTEQEITGEGLNEVLQSVIASLGAHYQMGGLVSPTDHIAVGDEPVVFIATTPGTYTYFGSQVVADGEVALLVWSGTAWSKQTPDIATMTEVSQLGQQVTLNSEKISTIDNEVNGEVSGYTPLSLEYGVINSDGSIPTTPNQNYKHIKIPVRVGDRFRVKLYGFDNGTSGLNNPQIGFYSGDTFTIEKNLGYDEPLTVITIPANVDYVCFVTLCENYNSAFSDYSVESVVLEGGLKEDVDTLKEDVDEIKDSLYESKTLDLFSEQISGYFDREGVFHETTGSTWLTSGKVAVNKDDIINYKLVTAGSPRIPQIGVWDGNGSYSILLAENTAVTGQYIVPDGVKFLHCTTITTDASVPDPYATRQYEANKIEELSEDVNTLKEDVEEIKNIENKRVLPSYVPKYIYAVKYKPLRLYPYNLVATNHGDTSVDVFVKRKLCNEHAAYLIPQSSISGNDVANNEVIAYGIRNYNGVEGELGSSTVKYVIASNPQSKQYIICLGDSLTEYIFNENKTAADLDYGSGAWVNEFSRMLCGIGDAIPNGGGSFNLDNYEVIGTRGSGTVKHEGRGGWRVLDYLTVASKSGGATNAFWDGTKFSLNHYVSTYFSDKGIASDGSNLSIIIMLNWNNVYTSFNSFKSNYQTLIDTIQSEMANVKIYIVGINCPPDRIYKSYTGDRSVSVASIKEKCFAVENVLEELEEENTNVVHIPVMPFFYPYGSYNSRNDLAECPRSGETTLLYEDYVHPNLQGFGQIADIVLAAFLNNR